ncbi:uncharacterized protein LOC116261568 isoform X3 [Nymphaea colorata]|uniref:uncharacterized protein LOC116261568 isoform X3 n=1 Tax=Nymphaea colorata TaxID=210225 RepID=UPI00214ED2C8|nr:uncharacterized protein LOC116261568 isoform X3 [Nymphaea colorata]
MRLHASDGCLTKAAPSTNPERTSPERTIPGRRRGRIRKMWEVTKLLAKTASMHLLFGHFGLSDAMYALLFGTVDHENISNIVRAPVRLLVKNGGQKINFCDLPPGFCVGVHKHLRSEFASLLMEHMTRMVGATATTTT